MPPEGGVHSIVFTCDYDRRGTRDETQCGSFTPGAAWGQALKEHQDKMGRLGKDTAFEIVAINDHITVSASGGTSTAIGSSLQRLTDEERILKPRETLAGQSLHVSWDALEIGRAYRFLKTGVPLVPQRGVDGKLIGTMVRLTDKAIVVVQAVEDSVPNSFWYLLSVDGRRGWVNGDSVTGKRSCAHSFPWRAETRSSSGTVRRLRNMSSNPACPVLTKKLSVRMQSGKAIP